MYVCVVCNLCCSFVRVVTRHACLRAHTASHLDGNAPRAPPHAAKAWQVDRQQRDPSGGQQRAERTHLHRQVHAGLCSCRWHLCSRHRACTEIVSPLSVRVCVQVASILNPIVLVLKQIPELCKNEKVDAYVEEQFGGVERLQKDILIDFFRSVCLSVCTCLLCLFIYLKKAHGGEGRVCAESYREIQVCV